MEVVRLSLVQEYDVRLAVSGPDLDLPVPVGGAVAGDPVRVLHLVGVEVEPSPDELRVQAGVRRNVAEVALRGVVEPLQSLAGPRLGVGVAGGHGPLVEVAGLGRTALLGFQVAEVEQGCARVLVMPGGDRLPVELTGGTYVACLRSNSPKLNIAWGACSG